ncbi:protein AGENET DOMAIN (AGD)-CONTAINING P1-like isoform X2 [Wolffia australiana]
MMYKKGTKVEVLDKKEVPCGSWRLAEIISSSGRLCRVKYDPFGSGMNDLEEKVPRKFIRPRLPQEHGQIKILPGDIVEVLDRTSWKLAELVTGSSLNFLTVRLLGSPQTLTVQRSGLRLRQCWVKNKWVAIGKEGRCNGGEMLPLKVGNYKGFVEDESFAKGKKRGLQIRPGSRKKLKGVEPIPRKADFLGEEN